MRFLKFLFSVSVSVGIILLGYGFIWDFMAKKRVIAIETTLKESNKFNFEYDNIVTSGYPNNINIKVENLRFDSKNSNNEIHYKVGDVIFDIYPFVLQQQADISIPTSQMFTFNYNGELKKFKVQAQVVDLNFLDDTVTFDLTELKIFDVDANKLILKADKFYYKGSLSDSSRFEVNFKNLKIRDYMIDSILLKAKLENINQTDVYAILLNMAILEGDEFKQYFTKNLEFLNESGAIINIENMKLVDEEKWFELVNKFKIDKRHRVVGPLDVIASDVETAEKIIATFSGNDDLNIESLPMLQRLISKNDAKFIRLSGKLERGSLYLFNQKIARTKSLDK